MDGTPLCPEQVAETGSDPDAVRLRPLQPSDEPVLWEMLYLAIHVPEGQPPPPHDAVQRPPLARYVAGWGRPTDSGYLALCGGAPVGAAWTRLLRGTGAGYGYVDDGTPELSIAVRPGQRGRGIGRRLLAAGLDDARRRYPGVSLSVSADNPARRLYERYGFRVLREEGEALVMLLRFGQAGAREYGGAIP